MSVHIQWLVENIVLHIAVSGEASNDTIHDALEDAATMLDESDAVLVHSVIDTHAAVETQLSVAKRVEAIRPLLTHPKCGWLMVIRDANPLITFVSSTAAKVFKARFRQFKTMEEALQFLEGVAPNLPDDFKVADYV